MFLEHIYTPLFSSTILVNLDNLLKNRHSFLLYINLQRRFLSKGKLYCLTSVVEYVYRDQYLDVAHGIRRWRLGVRTPLRTRLERRHSGQLLEVRVWLWLWHRLSLGSCLRTCMEKNSKLRYVHIRKWSVHQEVGVEIKQKQLVCS
jgi:hypothetical protein